MVIGTQIRTGITAWTMLPMLGIGAAMAAGMRITTAGTTDGRIRTTATGTMIGRSTMILITLRGMMSTTLTGKMIGTTNGTMIGTTTVTTIGRTIGTTATGIPIPRIMGATARTVATGRVAQRGETDGITTTTMSGTTRTHGGVALRAR